MIDFTLAELLTGLDLSDEEQMSLRDRCGKLLLEIDKLTVEPLPTDRILDAMVSFVTTEIGRASLLRPMSPEDRYEAMLNDGGTADSEETEAEKPERENP